MYKRQAQGGALEIVVSENAQLYLLPGVGFVEPDEDPRISVTHDQNNKTKTYRISQTDFEEMQTDATLELASSKIVSHLLEDCRDELTRLRAKLETTSLFDLELEIKDLLNTKEHEIQKYVDALHDGVTLTGEPLDEDLTLEYNLTVDNLSNHYRVLSDLHDTFATLNVNTIDAQFKAAINTLEFLINTLAANEFALDLAVTEQHLSLIHI